MWLDSTNAMGLEIMGEIVLRNGQISMEVTHFPTFLKELLYEQAFSLISKGITK